MMRLLKPSLLARWSVLLLVLVIGNSPQVPFCGSAGPNDIGYLSFYGIVPMPHSQWSPDGRHIIFVEEGEIYRVTADGSNLQLILESEGPNEVFHSPRISPDGMRIVYMTTRYGVSREAQKGSLNNRRNFEIETSLLDGTDRRRLTNSYMQETNPVWSPDGSRIALMRELPGGWPLDYVGIYTMAADGSDKELILPREPLDFDLFPDIESGTHWDADAATQEYFLRDIILWHKPDFDVSTIPRTFDWAYWDETTESFVQQQRAPNRGGITSNAVADDLFIETNFDYDAGPVWSPNGNRIAFNGTVGFSQYVQLTPELRSKKIAGADIPKALYTVNADGSDLTPVLNTSSLDDGYRMHTDRWIGFWHQSGPPAWSPDGRRIAFFGYIDPAYHQDQSEIREIDWGPGLGLYEIGVDGSGLREIAIISESRLEAGELAWSPDGKSLLLSTMDEWGIPREVHVIRLDGSVPRLSALGLHASWSPDGSRIAVIGSSSPDEYPLYLVDRLYTMAPDGTDIQVIVERDEDGELRAVNAPVDEENCFLFVCWSGTDSVP